MAAAVVVVGNCVVVVDVVVVVGSCVVDGGADGVVEWVSVDFFVSERTILLQGAACCRRSVNISAVASCDQSDSLSL